VHPWARYGELARLEVRDFNPDAGTVTIRQSKSGKSRHVVLTSEGHALFSQLTAGRAGEQIRPMAEAVQRAAIKPRITFHGLRHTWASLAVMSGMPLMVVARNLGHADTRMVERHYGHLAPSFIADAISQACAEVRHEGEQRPRHRPLSLRPWRTNSTPTSRQGYVADTIRAHFPTLWHCGRGSRHHNWTTKEVGPAFRSADFGGVFSYSQPPCIPPGLQQRPRGVSVREASLASLVRAAIAPPSTSTEKPPHKITARAWPSDAGALLLLGAARQAYELIGCNSHLG
jgi:hypothetical protein